MVKLEQSEFGDGYYFTVGYFTSRKKAEAYIKAWTQKNRYHPAWRITPGGPPKFKINPEVK